MILRFLFCLVLVLGFASPSIADEKAPLDVVVTIKPVHSLVSQIMSGVGVPHLLLKGNSSPHHFQLKPSDASRLYKADLVVWVGPSLETRLIKPLSSGARKGPVFSLLSQPGITLLPFRGEHNHDHGEAAAHHDGHKGHDDHKGHDHHKDHKAHKGHDDHKGHDHHKDHKAHKDHDDHKGHDHHKDHKAHKDHDDHKGHDHHKDHKAHKGHDDHKGHDHHKDHKGHDGHKGHDHAGEMDPHIWLDVDNAIVIAKALVKQLSALRPKSAKTFEANGKALVAELEALDAALKTSLSPVQSRAYMVFHDAYQYFSGQYGLSFAGAIALQPEAPISAKHLRELQKDLTSKSVVCVFSEPQYSDKMVKTLIGTSSIRSAVLDPLGASLPEGAGSYTAMMKKLGASFSNCLAATKP